MPVLDSATIRAGRFDALDIAAPFALALQIKNDAGGVALVDILEKFTLDIIERILAHLHDMLLQSLGLFNPILYSLPGDAQALRSRPLQAMRNG